MKNYYFFNKKNCIYFFRLIFRVNLNILKLMFTNSEVFNKFFLSILWIWFLSVFYSGEAIFFQSLLNYEPLKSSK